MTMFLCSIGKNFLWYCLSGNCHLYLFRPVFGWKKYTRRIKFRSSQATRGQLYALNNTRHHQRLITLLIDGHNWPSEALMTWLQHSAIVLPSNRHTLPRNRKPDLMIHDYIAGEHFLSFYIIYVCGYAWVQVIVTFQRQKSRIIWSIMHISKHL